MLSNNYDPQFGIPAVQPTPPPQYAYHSSQQPNRSYQHTIPLQQLTPEQQHRYNWKHWQYWYQQQATQAKMNIHDAKQKILQGKNKYVAYQGPFVTV